MSKSRKCIIELAVDPIVTDYDDDPLFDPLFSPTFQEKKEKKNMPRKINLKMIEGALKSPKTPAGLKRGLMKKYGHLLTGAGVKLPMETLATTVKANPKKKMTELDKQSRRVDKALHKQHSTAIQKLERRKFPREIVPGMEALLSPVKKNPSYWDIRARKDEYEGTPAHRGMQAARLETHYYDALKLGKHGKALELLKRIWPGHTSSEYTRIIKRDLKRWSKNPPNPRKRKSVKEFAYPKPGDNFVVTDRYGNKFYYKVMDEYGKEIELRESDGNTYWIPKSDLDMYNWSIIKS